MQPVSDIKLITNIKYALQTYIYLANSNRKENIRNQIIKLCEWDRNYECKLFKWQLFRNSI